MKRTKEIVFTRKKKPAITIYSLIAELQTWVYFSPAEIRQAQASRIVNDLTAPYFKSLVSHYKNGDYADLDVLADKLKALLKNISYPKG